MKLDEYLKSSFPDDGGASILLLGSSRSGKTTLARYIMDTVFDEDYKNNGRGSKKDRKPIRTILTHSPNAKPLAKLSKDMMMSGNGHNPRLLDMAKMTNAKAKNKYNYMFFYDDVLNVRHKRTIESLVMTDRNSNISGMISLQYHKLIGPNIRSNASFIFLLNSFGEGEEHTIKLFLGAHLPQEWTYADKLNFYKHYVIEGKGRAFIINNLDHEVVYVNQKRKVFSLRELIDQYNNKNK